MGKGAKTHIIMTIAFNSCAVQETIAKIKSGDPDGAEEAFLDAAEPILAKLGGVEGINTMIVPAPATMESANIPLDGDDYVAPPTMNDLEADHLPPPRVRPGHPAPSHTPDGTRITYATDPDREVDPNEEVPGEGGM